MRAGRDDPTRPERWMVESQQARPELPTLSSVLHGGGRRLAVIGGRVMAEGELREGVKLWKVEADRVVLSMGDGPPVTVHLDKSKVIKEVR